MYPMTQGRQQYIEPFVLVLKIDILGGNFVLLLK